MSIITRGVFVSFCILTSLLILLAAEVANALPVQLQAPPRQAILLTDWQFAEEAKGDDLTVPPSKETKWEEVAVPHVFRQSGLPDNAAGWYRHALPSVEKVQGRRFYLMLEGAASIKDVYVNGKHVGQHKGPFSASAFDLTPFMESGKATVIDVRVSNRDDEAVNCFSRSTLYYVNGGMFRKARLMITDSVHLFPESGSCGVYLTPQILDEKSGKIDAKAVVRNALDKQVEVVVRHNVADLNDVSCGVFESKQTIAAGKTVSLAATGRIAEPKIWDIGKPNLYKVRTEIVVDGQVTDAVTNRIGFRTIAFKEGRFYLNGREVQFRGVNKHAQNEYSWNAQSDDELRREWQEMIEMGGNMVRLAHYPHAGLEYDIADEHGIVVWAENGYAGQVWKDPGNDEKTITPDGERLTREMVRQNWNHPSILFWSAGNETILDVVSHYAQLIRDEKDPNRLVTYAANDKDPKNCDFVAYNTYDGWYTNGPYTDFSRGNKNLMISETGSGDWITHHVPYGTVKWVVDKYEPEEYAEMFTEYRLQTVCRNAIEEHPMFLWWNFREFYNLKFKKNRNTKGLQTLAGEPKDISFLFQAFFNPKKPVMHLCGRNHFLRGFAPDNGLKAYSNAEELQLTLNGVAQEKIKNGSYKIPDFEVKGRGGESKTIVGIPVANVFFWKTALKPGKNVVEVSDGKGHSDHMIVYQKGDAAASPDALVQNLKSSNENNPAYFIEIPAESQRPVYTDVDGSSDNTFDVLPKEIQGAFRIATRRLSDSKQKTDLSFQIAPSSRGATVFVLFSTGTYPKITLKEKDKAIAATAESMRKSLAAGGFKLVRSDVQWRDHQLNLTGAELWSRKVKPGETVELQGETLDYAVLIKE